MRHQNSFDTAAPVKIPLPARARPAVDRPRGIVAQIVARFRAGSDCAARRRRFIREFREMSEMSDRMLRDVGLHRGDITETRLRELLKDPANWDV